LEGRETFCVVKIICIFADAFLIKFIKTSFMINPTFKKYILFSIAFLLVALVLPEGLTAQKPQKPAAKGAAVKWYSFEEAYKLNKKKPKKTFVDVYTDWCGWCKKMDAETFANPTIAKYMNDNFYCVKLDGERKDTVRLDGQVYVNPNPTGRRSSHQLAVELLKGKMSYPSCVFLNEKGQKITSVAGYQGARDFEGVIKYFGTDAYLKSTWEEFRATFKGDLK
jgi:thioredoxin-related protein